MQQRILRLNKAGYPLDWLSKEKAACMLIKDRVLWSLGDMVIKIRGGFNFEGKQSTIELPSILATDGKIKNNPGKVVLSNKLLFRRDKNCCLYCGKKFKNSELSRDHIIPVSRNGEDIWTNVVTCCKRCNGYKANRTPEEANLSLLAVPFIPNRYEFLYLANRNVLGDQMEFLKSRFSNNGCWI